MSQVLKASLSCVGGMGLLSEFKEGGVIMGKTVFDVFNF